MLGLQNRAATLTVIYCFYQKYLSRSLPFFLCELSLFFYEADLGVPKPLGALHWVYKEGRVNSQLPLYLLCALEHPNSSGTHAASQCSCLLHHQDQQNQTSGKLFLWCSFPYSEASRRMETSLVKFINDALFAKFNYHISVLILLGPSAALVLLITTPPSMKLPTWLLEEYTLLVFILLHWPFILYQSPLLSLPHINFCHVTVFQNSSLEPFFLYSLP